MTVACSGTIRGRYLCTQCMGAQQPQTGPLAELLFVLELDGDPDAEEYACTPCMDGILDGTQPLTRFRLEIVRS